MVEDFLTKGEKVILNIGDYYATNRRLIHYDKHFGGEEFADLPYDCISGIRTGSKNNRGLGASLIAFGVLFVYLTFFEPLLLVLAFVCWVFGAVLLVLNFSYYELEVVGGRNWKLKRLKSGKTKEIIKLIRQNLFGTGGTSAARGR